METRDMVISAAVMDNKEVIRVATAIRAMVTREAITVNKVVMVTRVTATRGMAVSEVVSMKEVMEAREVTVDKVATVTRDMAIREACTAKTKEAMATRVEVIRATVIREEARAVTVVATATREVMAIREIATVTKTTDMEEKDRDVHNVAVWAEATHADQV
jgi:hypothetical protein